MLRKKWSLHVGRYAGIAVFIHWTFLVLLAWIFISNYNLEHNLMDALWSVGFVLAIFGCVVLHEFGHALTARRFNVATRDVTLYPIGGVASLESMPDKPGQELLVAIAGPAVNIAIAIVLWVYLNVTGMLPSVEELQNTGQVDLSFGASLLGANVILAVFNMIPAFPMDGGRVLRAIMSFNMNRARATKIAARVGQVIAVLFVLLGFYYDFWLAFIGMFIFLGAGGEVAYEETRSVLSGYRVKDVIMTRYVVLQQNQTLSELVTRLLDGQDQEFLVSENGQVLGVIGRRELIAGLGNFGKSAPVSMVMRTDFITVSPDMALDEVFRKMNTTKSSAFPVVDNGLLIGMIDRENINELIMVHAALSK